MSTILLKCRICLRDFEEKAMRPLFDEEEHIQAVGNVGIGDTYPMNISEQIELCCGVKLRKSDEMPSRICNRCSGFLQRWFRFRQLCLNSQIYWESSKWANSSELGYTSHQFIDNEMEDCNYLAEPADSPTTAEGEDEIIYSQVLMLDTDQETATSQEDNYINNDESEDFLSPTPSPEPKPLASKRKPGRPRKPDYELRAKRKQSTEGNQQQSTSQQKKLEEQKPVSYECNLCGNVYQKKSAFTAHKTSHTDFKPHQCELCDKSFRQMGELRAHIRRHTGERPYKCLYCERRFSDRSEKLRHERVHTNTRPYECKVCGKSFTHSTILKNHSLVHSGKKNYNCAICSKSFSLLHQLKAHLQTLTHRSREIQNSESQSAITSI